MSEGSLTCFGYGSLVNTSTHDYAVLGTIVLHGWRRVWSHRSQSPNLSATSLSMEPAEGCSVLGVVLEVPPELRADLARRERGYDLTQLAATGRTRSTPDAALATYITSKPALGSDAFPILQSYLDVVLSGYFDLIGPDGIKEFLDTTSGWSAPILMDRATPRYPRARSLTPELQDKIDTALREKGATFI